MFKGDKLSTIGLLMDHTSTVQLNVYSAYLFEICVTLLLGLYGETDRVVQVFGFNCLSNLAKRVSILLIFIANNDWSVARFTIIDSEIKIGWWKVVVLR
jgi:hypothetical protein